MKNASITLISFFLLVAFVRCGGKLSDEQRKQMREGAKEQTIQKVSDAEITDAAFKLGRELVGKIEEQPYSRQKLDSLAGIYGVRLHQLEPGTVSSREIENQLIEAYIVSAATGTEQPDNVQALEGDSLLYTKPILETMPDGTIMVKGTWNIIMAKKKVVLSLQEK